MKSIKSFVVAALFCGASFAANASTIVDFSYSYQGNPYSFGSFTGLDSNNDGYLTLNELTEFHDKSYGLSPAALSSFGSFDIANNVWNANASGWGVSNFAWFSWNNDNSSVNKSWATMTTAVEGSTNVPEPASVAIFGLGLLGLMSARRRKQ